MSQTKLAASAAHLVEALPRTPTRELTNALRTDLPIAGCDVRLHGGDAPGWQDHHVSCHAVNTESVLRNQPRTRFHYQHTVEKWRYPDSDNKSDPEPEPLRSVHASNLPEIVNQLGLTNLVTTYQSGHLMMLRRRRCAEHAFPGVRKTDGTGRPTQPARALLQRWFQTTNRYETEEDEEGRRQCACGVLGTV